MGVKSDEYEDAPGAGGEVLGNGGDNSEAGRVVEAEVCCLFRIHSGPNCNEVEAILCLSMLRLKEFWQERSVTATTVRIARSNKLFRNQDHGRPRPRYNAEWTTKLDIPITL